MNKLNVKDYFDWRYEKVNWNQYGLNDDLIVIERDMYNAIEGFIEEYMDYLKFEGSFAQWADNLNLKNFY